MIVSVALEQRFSRLPDGSIWTPGAFAHAFWQRYLDVFDEVRCIARVKDVQQPEDGWHRADGPLVSFVAVPYYLGPWEFIRRAWQVRRIARRAAAAPGAFVLRLPGAIGDLTWSRLVALGRPFGVEVVGDPYDVFARAAMRHPLRPILRRYATAHLQRQCRDAAAAMYVTAHALQRRYPTRGQTFSASSIELRHDAFVARPRIFTSTPRARLLFVGSLEQYYKAPDVLIQAFAQAVRGGLDLSLTIVGDGRTRSALEKMASEAGCADRIHFSGHVSRGEVCAAMDRSDLFVLPSRTEGLPRALIEAMARGLPCIGSSAGGIPELLPDSAIVPPGDPGALAKALAETIGDGARMTRMSARNLDVARSYTHDLLQPRRREFYRAVREATEGWMKGRAPACAPACGEELAQRSEA